MEEGEHPKAAFLREIEEELGYKANIVHELGYIEEHKSMTCFMQRSYCYIAQTVGVCNEPRFTEQEQALGLSIHWMTMDKAVELMHASVLHSYDYAAKFMTYRDQLILAESYNFLSCAK
ncbi:ADP-ribose pyrophosphatase YjhB (NUDIX family) [Paenibacillus shirakamiensis]|uniref:ADP-ribose pyrophosphatase YjhB (NUDIX family) n=2 Tax=Paenibacillus shirakamiensis TaxID=1265935 RepID=A0ABS4JEH4_9BACL|nr:ADP-ribose pyrophosphatase YjhB (NUDIX family) [Paenibacillus shirakamiensis]